MAAALSSRPVLPERDSEIGINPVHLSTAQETLHVSRVTNDTVYINGGSPVLSGTTKAVRTVVDALPTKVAGAFGAAVGPNGFTPPPSPPAMRGQNTALLSVPLGHDVSSSTVSSSDAPIGLSVSLPTDNAFVPRSQSSGDISPDGDQATSSQQSAQRAKPNASLLHPSSALPVPLPEGSSGPSPIRRNTTGSSFVPTHGHTRSGGSIHARDVSLDSDIFKEAEQIRRERTSKRAREQRAAAQAEAEAKLTAAHPLSKRPPGAPAPEITTDDEGVSPITLPPAARVATREDEETKVVMGNLIGEGHVNYVLMYNMLTGIRIGVSRWQAKMKRALTPEDYTASHKYSFDITGNELTPSARYDFKFKDYAPWVFREMREQCFHLDPADYLLSLTSKYILSELGSPGKSGSFFYFSRDYRFIIKTIHHTEHKFLRAILPKYHNHVKTNPHTLLSRFYGLHRVKLPRGRKIHFVIMNNLFPPHRDIHETYDLKGSTVGREYPEEKARQDPRAVLKDLNWINRDRVLELGPEKRALLTEQLRRDSEFLSAVNVMDYSLLIGIHKMERGNRDNLRKNTLKVFQPSDMPGRSPARRRRISQSARSEHGTVIPDTTRASSTARRSTSADASHRHNRVPSSELHNPASSIGSLTTALPDDLLSTDRRQDLIFYQDEGGLRATDERNEPLETIYYLGVIDITTPYNTKKRAEHLWKGMGADRHKISPVPSSEYASRFLAFLTAVMRGGEGGQGFKAE